ncbi:hypothetical protein HPB49_013128 [Dermacentor silvarum]|uniref:Uncharacterized protein n=1 Tax=Dermacentor silvarum TaxID=543639 RepID=A0ACB8D5P1_DERSI|nr:hypothetical protein HPB49_013128 [Dermacentor silvarum]
MEKMRDGDIEYFKKYYRMVPQQCLVGRDLDRQYCIREPISSAERLAMTLRYLSSGDIMQDIALSFRVGISTACLAVRVTCRALWHRLQPIYMPKPDVAAWLRTAEGFGRTWQFPNCIGAVDGKHVHIKRPKNSGTVYFNYKGTYSIVLLAIVDSDYKFVVVDIGAYGKQSDGGVLQQSQFRQRLEQGQLQLPRSLALPNTMQQAPCVLVGDEAFQLRPDFLRPYPGRELEDKKRIFNYRLSRARRCAENAFGILVTRWRILERTMGENPKNAEEVVKALCVLHNFLMHRSAEGDDAYCGPGYSDSINGFGLRRETELQDDKAAMIFYMAAIMQLDAGIEAAKAEADAIKEELLIVNNLMMTIVSFFKRAFRVTPATFCYTVDAVRPLLERQNTNMREAIALNKRVVIGLYQLCSSAEDRSVAELFAVGCSTVNVAYRELCEAIIHTMEAEWIKMATASSMAEHIHKCTTTLEFPQAMGSLDGCHFPVSPPKESATDYRNYKER